MSNTKKKICIVTGGRADYYLLKNFIKNLNKIKNLEITIIVTGQHLSNRYGNTGKIVFRDFGRLCKFINMNIKESKTQNILESLSTGIKQIGKFLKLKKPDLVVLLGDRYEILSAGVASIFNNLKIAHIHGGELTIGSIDDIIRHSLTKFSQFHFVSNELYRKRVIQLGENPKNVFNVGSLGVENINKTTFLNKEELKKKLKIKFNKYNFLITINSFIEEEISLKLFLENLLLALNKLNNTTIIFTLPNSDINSDLIKNKILKFCNKKENSYFFKSLGSTNYLSCMKYCDLVIGNSSSGIIEAPSFNIPTINIGNRQKGRLKSKSIINTGYFSKDIENSIKKGLSPSFRKKIKKIVNPYYKKNTTQKIISIIKNKILKKKYSTKKFYDINK